MPDTDAPPAEPLLVTDGIQLGLDPSSRDDAVTATGAALVELDVVEPGYADAMHEREAKVSSYIGAGFAIPHGTNEARSLVKRAQLVFLQFAEAVDWEGEQVHACVGIAAAKDEHLAVMQRLANVLMDDEQAEQLRTTDDAQVVIDILDPRDD